MKRIEGDHIEIMGLRHYLGGLIMNGENTVENARITIDNSNARRIKDEWITEPEQYLIVCHEWYRWEEDDGTFIRSEDIISVIEKYPADQKEASK